MKKLDKNISELFQTKTNWKTIHKVLYKLAKGNEKIINGNGVSITTRPNLDAAKLLLEYSFGKPSAQDAEQVDTKDAMKDFSEFVKSVNTPKRSVNADGLLTDNLNTDGSTVGSTDAEKVLNINQN